MQPADFVFLFGAVAFGALAKGATGLGFPLITVPIIALFVEPRMAVILISVPNMMVNFLILGRGGVPLGEVKRVWPLAVAGVLGVVAGANLLAILDTSVLSVLLGSISVAFALFGWLEFNPKLAPRGETFVGPAVGLVSGLLQGSTGASGPPLAMYLYSLGLAKRYFVYLITALFLVFNSVQVLTFLTLGLYDGENLFQAALMLAPTLVGLLLGFVVQDRLNQRMFNRLMLTVVAFTGANLLLRGLHIIS